MDISGTYLWYYNICKREVYLMSRGIVPDQHDENIDLGRFIHENYYKRNNKEVSFGNVRFDVIFQSKDELVIGETKKTSKFMKASKYQLLFYLRILKDAGINARGQLLYPEERKRVNVYLDKENEKKLDEMIEEIEVIFKMETPPEVEGNHYCKSCGYREYCYA